MNTAKIESSTDPRMKGAFVTIVRKKDKVPGRRSKKKRKGILAYDLKQGHSICFLIQKDPDDKFREQKPRIGAVSSKIISIGDLTPEGVVVETEQSTLLVN